MTVPQRMVLYGTCVVALVNSVGLLVLVVQQNQQHARLQQTEARLAEVEQSSVVEFIQEVPRGAAGLRAGPGDRSQYQQYSRNKRSEEKDLQREHHHDDEGKGLRLKEASQEVGEEKDELKLELKHKHRHGQHYNTQDDMMMMMTYSMVPVRWLYC